VPIASLRYSPKHGAWSLFWFDRDNAAHHYPGASRTPTVADLLADAYLVASAERTGVGEVASFDRGIDRVPTVRRVEPE
jgi:predicted nucleic acid-binding protein